MQVGPLQLISGEGQLSNGYSCPTPTGLTLAIVTRLRMKLMLREVASTLTGRGR
jgi:hypothetical protein